MKTIRHNYIHILHNDRVCCDCEHLPKDEYIYIHLIFESAQLFNIILGR